MYLFLVLKWTWSEPYEQLWKVVQTCCLAVMKNHPKQYGISPPSIPIPRHLQEGLHKDLFAKWRPCLPHHFPERLSATGERNILDALMSNCSGEMGNRGRGGGGSSEMQRLQKTLPKCTVFPRVPFEGKSSILLQSFWCFPMRNHRTEPDWTVQSHPFIPYHVTMCGHGWKIHKATHTTHPLMPRIIALDSMSIIIQSNQKDERSDLKLLRTQDF